MMSPSRIPSGVFSLHGEEARRHLEAERRCLDVLLERGFEPVHLPVLEFAGTEGDGYRFIDPTGRVVAIRTDFTPLAARMLARGLEAQSLPLAICYAGEVVRPQPVRLRRVPELYQVGFESYGVAGGGESVLVTLLDLMGAAGLAPERCHVTVGEASLLERMATQVLEGSPGTEVLELLRARDVDAVADLVGGRTAACAHLEAALLGEPADTWGPFFGVEAELARVEGLIRVAEGRGVTAGLDAAPRTAGDYYRGLELTVWGRCRGAVLASGGEYRIAVSERELDACGASLTLPAVLAEAMC